MAKANVREHLASLCRTHPCMIVTTLHSNGTPNAGTFGAYTAVGPEEIGVAVTTTSHTYANIKRSGEFAINIPNVAYVDTLQYCASKIAPGHSELEHAGLSASVAEQIKPPLIIECVVNIECRLWKEFEIGTCNYFVAKMLCGKIEESCRDEDGGLDPVKARTVTDVRYPEPLYATFGQVVRAREPQN